MLGAAASLLLLFIFLGVLPLARQWQAREDLIATENDRLARLRGLLSAESQLREAVERGATALESGPRRLLSGRTPALAASSLQSLLQDFADQSQITVSRLDVAGAPDAKAGSLPTIPATVSAIGDIHGITEMLSHIQYGPRMLEIAELTIRPNPALRGELLQMTVKLRAPYIGD
jgi:hypothetical protein